MKERRVRWACLARKGREEAAALRRGAGAAGGTRRALPQPPLSPPLQVCRFVPWAVKNYRLEDMTTPAELRRNVAALFKARPPVADPRVVDVLIYKGREELESIVLQHKQRHHLVGEYVLGPRAMRKASRVAAEGVAGGRSAFLDAFLKNTA